jgi:glycosyltransferase involved in cell wall biosynthesis
VRRLIGSDVTQLRETPFTTGVQRVMLETHKSLARSLNPSEFQLRGFSTLELPGEKYLANPYLAADPVLAEELVALEDLDIALLLDLNLALNFKDILLLKRHKRITVVSIIHDIIPILNPEWFPSEQTLTKRYFRDFLQKTLAISDHLVFTSSKVKNDVLNLGWKTDIPLHVFHLGATHLAQASNKSANEVPTFVCVSTIEPRKGYMDILDAFDILREKGVQIKLEIVGRPGWLCKDILERITQDPDYGSFINWHSGLSDEGVAKLYENATAAIVASFDEGFGLAIEESLARQVPVIARKIPVFEERPNPNVFYFAGGGEGIANEVLASLEREWIPLGQNEVRLMHNFAEDIRELLENIE